MTSLFFFSNSGARGFSISNSSSSSTAASLDSFFSGSDEYHLVDSCRDDAPKGEIGAGRTDGSMDVLGDGRLHVLNALLCLRRVL